MADTGTHPFAAIVHSLALVLGACTLLLALGVGLGASRAANLPVQGFEPNDVVVTATAASSSGAQLGLPTQSLTPDDATALGKRGFVPDGVAAAPFAGLRTPVSTPTRSLTTDLIGSTVAFAAIRDYTMASGRFLTTADVASAQPVMVVGQTVVRRLFNGDNPVGHNVVVGNNTFLVVGTFAAKGFSGSFDQDDLVVTPISAVWAQLLGNKSEIDEVVIQASSSRKVAAVKAQATATLLQRHGFTNPAQADFQVRTPKDLSAGPQAAARTSKRALALASAALLLGAAIHLATLLRYRPLTWAKVETPETAARLTGDLAAGLTRSVTRAVVATILGMALAVAGAGLVHRALGSVPPLRFRPWALALVAGAGLVVAVAAWLVEVTGAGEGWLV